MLNVQNVVVRTPSALRLQIVSTVVDRSGGHADVLAALILKTVEWQCGGVREVDNEEKETTKMSQ